MKNIILLTLIILNFIECYDSQTLYVNTEYYKNTNYNEVVDKYCKIIKENNYDHFILNTYKYNQKRCDSIDFLNSKLNKIYKYIKDCMIVLSIFIFVFFINYILCKSLITIIIYTFTKLVKIFTINVSYTIIKKIINNSDHFIIARLKYKDKLSISDDTWNNIISQLSRYYKVNRDENKMYFDSDIFEFKTIEIDSELKNSIYIDMTNEETFKMYKRKLNKIGNIFFQNDIKIFTPIHIEFKQLN